MSVRRRRSMRLAWATAAAMLFHVLLIASSDWRMDFLTVPSNQDRVITLSLEKALSEGFKDAEEEARETVNTPKIGKPLAIPSKSAAQITESTPEPAPVSEIPVSEIKATALSESSIAEIDESSSTPVEVEELGSPETLLPPPPMPIVASVAKEREPPLEQQQDAPTKETPSQTSAQEAVYFSELESVLALVTPGSFKSPLEDIGPVDVQAEIDVRSNELAATELNTAAELNLASRDSRPIPPKQKRILEKRIQKALRKSKARFDFDNPVEWRHRGQRYTAKFRQLKAASEMGIDHVQVDVATEQDGEYLTTTLRLKKLVFSNFAQFVDQWERTTAIHDDEMAGRFHSNTEITFASDRHATPIFHGKVTTAASSINRQGRLRKSDVFIGGLETRVKRIGMPSARTLMPDGVSDESVTIIVEQESHIRFFEQGFVHQQAVEQHGPPKRYSLGSQPTYIIAAPKIALHVSGVVNGLVSVYSPKRITVEGNIRYANHGLPTDGGDFLGLISGRNVIVAGRDVIADGDLDIQASVYARGRFSVKQIGGKRSGTLTILGSLSVGTLAATEPRYATKVTFDKRLEELRPPSFPVTEHYELVAQEQEWQVEHSLFFDGDDAEDGALK